MRWLALAALFAAGCGGGFKSTATISWQSNGNPGVPVCGAELQNCVAAVEVRDEETGAIAAASPAGSGSVTMPGSAAFAWETAGFDGAGRAISSGWQPVPAAAVKRF